ncbi:putative regulator of G protein signaling 17, 19, 20 (rgs17, 19, 20) [Schistosoma mansoni]|uniref:putative regulator of G protein signaling 17, 19, 20 (rgs17, 19, 20) n=1 Tax=Schistosoma mansoni TaxID=6183 RepID=UPI00022DC395|nr:putative regulator of G protein signaling 17, 19, 20 (rgs17, 19, 20) [Schistosoma mansoni]|eukprot:XP_018652909.1 putative regulator of G protein signaling 17, 19, 20 (rgs17, 19, 20) [Schistosoma mansoni]
MLNGPTVLLKTSTTSLCNPTRSSSSSTNNNHNNNDPIKTDLSPTTLFSNYSMHSIHNHPIYTTNLSNLTSSSSSSILYSNTILNIDNHCMNETIQTHRLSDSFKQTNVKCSNDTLLIHQGINQKTKSSEQLTLNNDEMMTIRRRLPPLGKSDSSETGLQIDNNNNNNNNETNNSIITMATKIVIESDSNENSNDKNSNINKYKTIEGGYTSNEEIASGKMLQCQTDVVNIEHNGLTKPTFPITSYSSLRDIDNDQSICRYCHNRLPSCTHQLNLLQPTDNTTITTTTTNNNNNSSLSTSMLGNRQKSTSAIPSCSTYEIRPNTTGKLSEYKHESYDPLSSNNNNPYFYNNHHNGTDNDKLLFPANFCHDNLCIITPSQYSINYVTSVQCSPSHHTYLELNKSNLSYTTSITTTTSTTTNTNTDTNTTNNNISSNNDHVQSLNYLHSNTFNTPNFTGETLLIHTNNSNDNDSNHNNHYTKSCTKVDQSHSESISGPFQRISLYFTNDTQNTSNTNSNDNHREKPQQFKSVIRNSIPSYSILRGSLKSYITEATYRTSGNRGIKTVSHQHTITVPTDSTNSCQASLIRINTTTNNNNNNNSSNNKSTKNTNEHFNTITDDKHTDEMIVDNEVSTIRRSLNSTNNTSQIIQDPRSRTCCFCWCCCCSCSCIRVRANLGESKRPSASNDPQSTVDCQITDEKITLEELEKWAESFDILMRSSSGQKTFREFLRSEYSEENIMFWLACEDIRKESNLEIVEEKARIIYEDFISILSPREVSLDSRVREIINSNMIEPTPHIFDEAQLQIYTLMHRDSYPRFLNSKLYKDMIEEIKNEQS